MAQKKRKNTRTSPKPPPRANRPPPAEKQYYSDPNDAYFREHFEELVDNHGGQWLVMADGEVVAICEGYEMHQYIDQIRARGIVPFIAPIPRPEEIKEMKVMARKPPKIVKHRIKITKGTHSEYLYDPNHEYFMDHFNELVQEHGGRWLVMADGEVVAICEGHEMPHYADRIRARGIVPFATPIPRPEELECLL